jgi:hypothetical protein
MNIKFSMSTHYQWKVMQSKFLLKFCTIKCYLKFNYFINCTHTLEIFCSVILIWKVNCYGSLIIDGCWFNNHQNWNIDGILHCYISLVFIFKGHTELLFCFFALNLFSKIVLELIFFLYFKYTELYHFCFDNVWLHESLINLYQGFI